MYFSIQLALFFSTTAAAYWLPETLESVKTCLIPKNTTGVDDTPTIVSTVAECGDRSRVIFQKGLTYNLITPLKLSALTNIELVFEGNVSLPENVTYVETVVNNTKIYPGRWINFAGTNVTLTGSKDPEDGWFIGHGELWWPAGAANSANNARPHFFSLKVDYLRARDLKVWKPVAWVFSMGGSYVWMTNTLIDAKSDDGFPFNTDGIDMSASNSLIDGFTIYNGDDLINVSPPTTNITVRNMYASGSHGIAVSCSSGTGGDYLFENAIVEDSLFGARFKGGLGTTCQLSNVTWSNFTITNTTYPIHFIENYVDQETGLSPGANVSLAAYATNFSWENITGRTGGSLSDGSCITDPCWSTTLGDSTEKALYLLCTDADHCKDFHFKNIGLEGYNGEPAGMECTGLNGVVGMGITLFGQELQNPCRVSAALS
ncbi:exopolygalacturonase C 1 [Seiridium cupressi]